MPIKVYILTSEMDDKKEKIMGITKDGDNIITIRNFSALVESDCICTGKI